MSLSVTSLVYFIIRDFEQWKWIESSHAFNQKIQCSFSFGEWEPMYLVLNSKIFYLLSCIFIWTPAPYHRCLLRFLHLASPNQLLSAPCFDQLHNPISQSLELKVLVCFPVLLNLLSSQASSIYFHEFLFFLSNILVQTLLQIQPFPNCVQKNSFWENINRFCNRVRLSLCRIPPTEL